MGKFIDYYKEFIESTELNLRDMKDDFASTSYGPGKWLRKEVLGHLIDSASNNHKRFVSALLTQELVFDTYDENSWVKLQNYKDSSWQALITLWATYNKHILHFIDSIPEEILSEPREEHNLDVICWEKHPSDEPATLEYLINDYFVHMQHHFEQIFS